MINGEKKDNYSSIKSSSLATKICEEKQRRGGGVSGKITLKLVYTHSEVKEKNQNQFFKYQRNLLNPYYFYHSSYSLLLHFIYGVSTFLFPAQSSVTILGILMHRIISLPFIENFIENLSNMQVQKRKIERWDGENNCTRI